jgi:hypothetical protein
VTTPTTKSGYILDSVVVTAGDYTLTNDSGSYTMTEEVINAITDGKIKVTTNYRKLKTPVIIQSDNNKKVHIGDTTTITISEDSFENVSGVTYSLIRSSNGGTSFNSYTKDVTQNGNVFTTGTLIYNANYQFKVKLTYTENDKTYSVTSNVVNVAAVLGTLTITYTYKEYNSENGLSFDPYLDNNLNEEATVYTYSNDDADMSQVVAEGYENTYKLHAPNIKSNYYDYSVVTDGLSSNMVSTNKTCTITCSNEMEAKPRQYVVTVHSSNSKDEVKSYYQQKTFLLDATDYCSETADNGYVWYYLDKDGTTKHVLSTSQYYKLRVTEDTDIYVEIVNDETYDATTIINDPVYTESTVNNILKVKMSMLVENYLPSGAVRTRTGVVYCAYDPSNGESYPTINSTDLENLIASSTTLSGSDGKTCTVGSLNGRDIKGYYTTSENVNGKFVFAPVAATTSTKVYVVYSYLTYTQNNISKTVVSAPVTASVADSKLVK